MPKCEDFVDFFLNKIIAFIRTHVEKKILIAFNKLAYTVVYPVFRRGGGDF